MTLLAFLVALALLIAVHEYGHYRMAVACDVKVLQFSIGLGHPIWRWRSSRPRPGQFPKPPPKPSSKGNNGETKSGPQRPNQHRRRSRALLELHTVSLLVPVVRSLPVWPCQEEQGQETA